MYLLPRSRGNDFFLKIFFEYCRKSELCEHFIDARGYCDLKFLLNRRSRSSCDKPRLLVKQYRKHFWSSTGNSPEGAGVSVSPFVLGREPITHICLARRAQTRIRAGVPSITRQQNRFWIFESEPTKPTLARVAPT